MSARPVVKRMADDGRLLFYCPACRRHHFFFDTMTWESQGLAPLADKTWEWNHNYEEPTVAPSLDFNKDEPRRRCHFFLRGGKIDYQNDCWHAMRGQQQVPMEPIDV